MAAVGNILEDLVSHGYTRLIVTLTNISEPPACRCIRIHRNHRNPATHRLFHHIVERGGIGHGRSDAVNFLRNGRLDKINLLLYIEPGGSRVSHVRANHLPGGFGSFTNRYEKRHGGGMSDDEKPISRLVRLTERFRSCSKDRMNHMACRDGGEPDKENESFRKNFH